MFLLKFSKPNKLFKIFFKNCAGRNNKGHVTVFSKGSRKKLNTMPTTYPTRWDDKLITVVSIIRNKKKLSMICKHITGSLSIRPFVLGVSIGQKTFSSNLPKKFWVNNLPGGFVILKFLPRYSIFSNLFIKNLCKYALANGTYCQVLEIFTDFNLIKVTLPSKQVKIVSGWNFVMLGRNSKQDHRFNILGKAGTNIVFGIKPKVRGVARNPVDHPHGGRTKTNQPEVSIWGWVAKRNK